MSLYNNGNMTKSRIFYTNTSGIIGNENMDKGASAKRKNKTLLISTHSYKHICHLPADIYGVALNYSYALLKKQISKVCLSTSAVIASICQVLLKSANGKWMKSSKLDSSPNLPLSQVKDCLQS